jgi:hypothetical protein
LGFNRAAVEASRRDLNPMSPVPSGVKQQFIAAIPEGLKSSFTITLRCSDNDYSIEFKEDYLLT